MRELLESHGYYMRILFAILACIIVLCSLSWAKTGLVDPGGLCENCHGTPPGHNEKSSDFLEGAHLLHRQLDCGLCHAEGGDAEHVDGIVTILPGIQYNMGTKISWPNKRAEPGSCGGRIDSPFQPASCHVEGKWMKCLWMPGKNCQPIPNRFPEETETTK